MRDPSDEREWFRHAYANWWKLAQTISDEKISTFLRDLRAHGISVYACFNLSEYGGAGDKAGDASVSDGPLKASLADASGSVGCRGGFIRQLTDCHLLLWPSEGANPTQIMQRLEEHTAKFIAPALVNAAFLLLTRG